MTTSFRELPRRALRALAWAGVGALLWTACSEDDPVDRITAPGTGGKDVFNFVVSSGGGFGVPSGSITHAAFRLAFVPPGEVDVFGRSTGDFGFFRPIRIFGNFPAYDLSILLRTAANDPRLPALDLTRTAARALRFCVLGSPAFTGIGPGFWDLFCELGGMKPRTRYTVVMARYWLKINGEHDLKQVLLGDVVDEPDELILLPGTPRGAPTSRCNFTVAVPIPRDANPFVLGFADSDGAGNIRFVDCVPLSRASDPTWWRNDEEALPSSPLADSLPVMPNKAGDFPRPGYTYNYLYLIEGQGTAENPVPAGPIAIRFQLGVDLDQNGNPIPDAYAPFPTSRLTPSQLVAVRGVLHPTASTVTFTGLRPLSGGYAYKMWLMNLHVDPPTAAPGVGVLVETTGAGAQPAETTAVFNPEDVSSRFSVTLRRAVTGVPLPDFSHFVITYEQNPAATEPGPWRFMFHQYIDRSNTDTEFSDDKVSSGGLILGAPAANIDGFSRRWGLVGQGLAHFFGDEFRARVEQLARPPLGFFYEGWLVGKDTAGNTFFRRIGAMTVDDPPAYTSLLDADVSRESGVVTETFVAAAINRVADAAELNIPPEALKVRRDGSRQHPYCAITQYWITLENKEGLPADRDAPGPTVAAVGKTPETFVKSPLCAVE